MLLVAVNLINGRYFYSKYYLAAIRNCRTIDPGLVYV